MKESRKKIVVVLGMHRSGTSAIARGLSVLGVELGNDLHPPGDDNPKGFWEDKNCLRINESLLQHLGSAYDKLGLSPEVLESLNHASVIRSLKLEAVEVLRAKFSQSDQCGFKDPRVSRLLPFWKNVFEEAGCAPGFVIAVRNPISVARSLGKRNGIEPEKSYFLWLEHVVSAVIESIGSRRVVVDYDVFMDNPKEELRRIADMLNLNPPMKNSAALKEFTEEFLEGKLRHTRFQREDLKLDPKLPEDVSRAYELALNLANGKQSFEDVGVQEEFLHIRQRWRDYAPAFGYANILEGKIVDLYHCIAERKEKLENLTKTLTKQQGHTEDLNRRLFQLTEQRGYLQSRYETEQEKARQLGLQIDESRAQAVADQEKARQLGRQLDESRAQAVADQEKARQLGRQLDESRAQAVAEQEKARQLGRQLDESRAQAAAGQDKVRQLGRQLDESRAQAVVEQEKARQLGRQLDESRAQAVAGQDKIRQLDNELNQTNRHLAFILSSNSWRLTSTFRFFRRNLMTRPYVFFRRKLAQSAHRAWQSPSLPPQGKQKFKSAVFRGLPFLFRRTQAYRRWQDFNAPMSAGTAPQIDTAMEASPTQPGAEMNSDYVPLLASKPLKNGPAKLICFYLPQFHRIPENDDWWGKGFTEWTNVKPAKPQFLGHYQPHVPGELGYYNLLDPAVQHRQVELAKLYGIGGFCFYFYWFGGKRLLETPIKNYLSDKGLDLSFCLCWANENWTRRWDGMENDVLVAQQHSSDDDLAFIRHVARYMRDPRYIRIGGKPMLLVYRPSLLPSAKKTARRWRNWCRDNDIGEIYLAYTQSFETVHPSRYGFDAAIEFPPNNSAPPDVTDHVTPIVEDFGCTVYDWGVFVERSKKYPQPGYKLFHSVCAGWDNTARRRNRSTVFVNNTPALYQRWLENAIHDTLLRNAKSDERLIFVNAWNEWAEGAHLEPDERYGYAWLNATRRALTAFDEQKEKFIVVTHDLHKHGAQHLSLNLVKALKEQFSYGVTTIALGPGPLSPDFEAYGPLIELNRRQMTAEAIRAEVKSLAGQGYRYAIVNSSASGWMMRHLADAGIRSVGLIHELPNIIRQLGLEEDLQTIDKYSEKVIFPSSIVMEKTAGFCPNGGWHQAQILPQGVYKRDGIADLAEKQAAKKQLSDLIGFPPDIHIVLGVGFGDHRKGVDIFVKSAIKTARVRPDVHFIWLGELSGEMKTRCMPLIEREAAVRENIHFPGFIQDTNPFYAAADIYALTSREDPFPSTALEALSAGTPVVMTAGTGGIEDLESRGCVHVIQSDHPEAFSAALLSLLDNPNALSVSARLGMELIGSDFGFLSYIIELLNSFGALIPRISVVVPNYNYSRYLEIRLGSILNQIFPPWEIIFLDDASSDDSVAVARKILASSGIRYRIICNEKTSGNVFGQWQKGVDLARGDHVWIAEADDVADRGFLEAVMKGFERDDIVLAYTQSKQINGAGKIICPHYLDYVKDVSAVKWLNSYANEGVQEIVEGLSVKNTIPNVSAVVFRREPLQDVLGRFMNEIRSYRVAGDWFVYVNVLKKGGLYYDARPFNHHRRHKNSVTIRRFELAELNEIARMQNYIANQFDLPAEFQRKARDYLDTLVEQFSLRNRYSEIEIRNSICAEN